MLIRKRSFIELLLPFTILAFLGQGTRFVDMTHISVLKWVFLILLSLYALLNKKILSFLPFQQKFLLFIYLFWCIFTSLWSEVSLLSFSKSALFALTVLTLISVGSLWVIKLGLNRSLYWLGFIMVVVLLSGALGGGVSDNVVNIGQHGKGLYGGLSGNPNNLGFLAAIVSPLIIWNCYQVKEKRWSLLMWILFLIADFHFLMMSYSRSAIAIFVSTTCFFVLSLPLSKKLLVTLGSLFCVAIFLLMMPVSLLETMAFKHVVKGSTDNQIFSSRQKVWEKSYQQAIEGGVFGGGFSVNIGQRYVASHHYGREKGNSQFAILEETGAVGFFLYVIILIFFYRTAIPCFYRLIGSDKVVMGLVLGGISGLLLESLVEAWWDSLGPEVICFWTFIGIAYGMIYLEKRKVRASYHKPDTATS